MAALFFARGLLGMVLGGLVLGPGWLEARMLRAVCRKAGLGLGAVVVGP